MFDRVFCIRLCGITKEKVLGVRESVQQNFFLRTGRRGSTFWGSIHLHSINNENYRGAAGPPQIYKMESFVRLVNC